MDANDPIELISETAPAPARGNPWGGFMALWYADGFSYELVSSDGGRDAIDDAIDAMRIG
ncbi:MAG: hypothetical protein ACT4OX_10520 [Actinomycetota bacterium]